MGLVAQVELELRDAGLIDFFKKHRPAFLEMARISYEFAKTYILPTGLPVRPDDVAGSLVAALETNELLRDYLTEEHLRQKYQYKRFADLILDRTWKEIVK